MELKDIILSSCSFLLKSVMSLSCYWCRVDILVKSCPPCLPLWKLHVVEFLWVLLLLPAAYVSCWQLWFFLWLARFYCVQTNLWGKRFVDVLGYLANPTTNQKTQRQTEAEAVTIHKPQGSCRYSITNRDRTAFLHPKHGPISSGYWVLS